MEIGAILMIYTLTGAATMFTVGLFCVLDTIITGRVYPSGAAWGAAMLSMMVAAVITTGIYAGAYIMTDVPAMVLLGLLGML